MSLSVQGANGVTWPRRELAPVRAAAQIERDEPSVADRTAGADANDYATDAMRLAALRRDAAATAAAATPRTHGAVDDNRIAGGPLSD
jgi:hypothetical protein